MKKIISLLLALALVFAAALLMTSCGGDGEQPCTEHVDTDENGMCDKCSADMVDYKPGEPVKPTVAITVIDQEGDLIGGVSVTLTERGALNGEGALTVKSGSDGKCSATLKAATYLVTIDYNPDAIGYYALVTSEIVVTESTSAAEIKLEDTTPNGTEARPFALSVDNNSLTIPAGETAYYVLYRAFNLIATVSATDIKIEYEGTEYIPDSDGKISFAFLGADTNSVATVKITSTGSSRASVDFLIESFPGTIGNPYVVTDLTVETSTPDVEKGETIYYSYTATASGTLTLTVTSEKTHAAMQNGSYQVSTDESDTSTISLSVASGDEVIINLTSAVDGSVTISFSLALN